MNYDIEKIDTSYKDAEVKWCITTIKKQQSLFFEGHVSVQIC